MKKQFIFIFALILLISSISFPSVQAGSAVGSCGGGCPSECASHGVGCSATSCAGSCGGTTLQCQCMLLYTSGCGPFGSAGLCFDYNGIGSTGCSASPSCDGLGMFCSQIGSSSCSYSCTSTQYSCGWADCTCSGTGCNPANNRQRCDGCFYYSVAGVPESCNNIDDNCNGQIDDGLSNQPCGNCGTRNCVSGSFGSCTGQGVCSPGSIQPCGNCGNQSCTSSCQWNTCIEGACEIVFAYWADMNNNPISNTDNLDKVKLITLSEELLIGKTITIDIYKSNTLFGMGILDWLVPDNKVDTLTQIVDSEGKVSVEWTVPDVDVTTYYYAYSHVAGYSEDYTSKATLHLETSPTENNAAPSAVITYPNYNSISNYKFSVGQQITFTQSSYDVDGTIESYSWDFNSGSPATSSSSAPVSVSYSSAGPKYISLTVVDDKGVSSTDTVGVLIDDSANQPPLVALTSPESGKTYSKKILCDATKTIDDNTPFEQLSFTWYFDSVPDPLHTNVNGTAGAYFEKIFDTAGAHSIAVTVDDGE